MLVSHDRSLLRSVCDEFWLVAKGGVAPFDGDLDDYQVYLLEQAKEARQARQQNAKRAAQAEATAQTAIHSPAPTTNAAISLATTPTTPANTFSKAKLDQMRKELAKVEAEMALLETKKASLEAAIGNTTDAASITAISNDIQATLDALAKLEAQWLTLGESLG